MIFDGIDFHNVSNLVAVEGGYRLSRLPLTLLEGINERAREMSFLASGVELRFKMVSDEVTILLKNIEAEEAAVLAYYWGEFAGPWYRSTAKIQGDVTHLVITRHTPSPEHLAHATKFGHRFNPEIVRILLPYTRVIYCGVKGTVVPPTSSEVPNQTYLAAGSSITHGSLGLIAPYYYPARIGQQLHMNAINWGLAGSFFLEPSVASAIIERNDWTVASIEMLTNIYHWDLQEIEKRIDPFLSIIANDKRPVIIIDMLMAAQIGTERYTYLAQLIRSACARYHLTYVAGKDLLSANELSHDLVHPDLEGMNHIVQGLLPHIDRVR